ncbi:MAG TPA: hypothetical protein PLJ12_03940, partial [Planctomycetota bacterium]|nr:hypothetical protein [Planctomycetota bacterium]
NNTRMTLISDTWLRENGVPGEDYVARRAAFYSQKLSGDNLMVKIMNDDIAQGVWQLLSQSGFDRYGKPGAAPAAGGEMVQVIEVLRGGQYVHMGISKATPKAEGEAFKTCLFGFMDVYNNLLQLQTVDRMPAFRSSTTSGNPR